MKDKHLLKENIAIIGKRGAGKSTLANLIKETFYNSHIMEDAEVVKMAGTLKDMARLFFKGATYDDTTIERMIEGDLKEQLIPDLGFSPRHVMQTLGTEWGRHMLQPNIWGDLWERQVNASDLSIICDDVRFDNEVTRVENIGFKIVRIISSDTESNIDTHPSEELPKHHADAIIINDKTAPLRVDIMELLDAIDDLAFGEIIIAKGDKIYRIDDKDYNYSMADYKDIEDAFYYANKEYEESLPEDDGVDDYVQRWKEERYEPDRG